jgi:ankyrin repeat protein
MHALIDIYVQVLCLGKELGADVNQAAVDGTTPLYIAAQHAHLGTTHMHVSRS